MDKINLNLLYVDNNTKNKEKFHNYFSPILDNIIYASDGQEGIFKCRENQIDLVVTYEKLPIKDAFDMILEIRQLNRYINSIIITNLDKNILKSIGKIDILNDYLPTNFKYSELVDHIKNNIDKIEDRRDTRKNFNLFSQYQNALDSSAIVSKTDTRGIITYVNDTFCEISKYTRDELIGKNHNIVRDPDMPSSLFSDLWRTIKAKMIFRCKLKNRAKNGTTYSTDTTIIPILDDFGKITEYIAVRFDITQLEQSLIEEKKAKESQAIFLANMSHEIRTPLNGILGFTKLLDESNLPEKEKEYVDIINNSASTLLHTINEILDISKIQNGNFQVEEIEFDLLKESTKIHKLFLAKADEKKINFKSDLDQNIPNTITSDMVKLKQVLSNLLSNAIKFTPLGGEILFSINVISKDKKCKLRFQVKDNGIGINKEEQNKIFNPFIQASSSTTRKYGGTGLGLAISKDIISLLGGELSLQSQLSKGSRFWFDLDFEFNDKKIPDVINSKDTIKKQYIGDILVAEDNIINQKLIKIILEQNGLNVTIVSNGKEAVDIFKQNYNSFDLIFLDINMPIMDGMVACKNINNLKIKYSKNTPIISLTANAIKGDKEKYLSIGFDEYLTKPIIIENLNKVLNKYLDSNIVEKEDNKFENLNVGLDNNKAANKLGIPIEFYNELLGDFLNTASDEFNILENYIKNKDFKNIVGQSHALKGVTANLSIDSMVNIIKQIETSAQNKEDIDYLNLIEKLNYILKQIN